MARKVTFDIPEDEEKQENSSISPTRTQSRAPALSGMARSLQDAAQSSIQEISTDLIDDSEFQDRLALDGSLRVDGFTDLGVEPSAAVRMSYALKSWSSIEAHVGRAFRAPTFYERYGPPQGYLRANPDLLPEDGVEGGLGLRLDGRRLSVELSLFAARLANTILYLNRNAYEVRPENAGALWRGGGELSASVQVRPWLRQMVSAELLLSRVDTTGAPLPATPPLILSTRTELDARTLWLNLPLRAFV